MNPELDLLVERVIRAPRAVVWTAWTEPSLFARWWVPAPAVCRVDRLEVRPGGALVTQLSEDGEKFVPHLDASFVVAEKLERIVFTNTIDSAWRPTNPTPIAMTAEVTLADHADGTAYRIVVRHGDPASRKLHEELGFADGWGSVTAQLAGVAESEAAG
ncbi:SRPBCC domain-containing protein [Kribbella lupini]|uniref:Activator of Hsp90 ATPase homologue 1/2-like C-terminal domain-containing protein n=1 Tax=Kribbella lupini TaxID=291602 RepID=A0ABN1ZZT1_9ACTN